MTGAAELARLLLRRDRLLLTAWVLLSVALPAAVARATAAAYPTARDLAVAAAAANANPAELATRGPAFAPTVGSLTAWTVASSGALLLGGVINLLLVVRYTRVEEQSGRSDLVAAGAVGRAAALGAALAVVVGADALIGVLVAAALGASGLPVAGASALGLVYATGGALFAALGALVAQVAAGAGAARGLAFGVLAVLFAVSAVGELSGSGLVWATPFGWARRVRAFAGEQWPVLLLFVLVAVALAAVAVAVEVRRDVGAGLLAARSGRAHAPATLRGPLGLAWRLHRASIAGWAVGALLLGALLGAALASSGDQLDTPAFRALGEGDPGQVFFRVVLYVLAQAVTASAVAAALRIRGQETAGLADPVLAGPVSRAWWAVSHLIVTAVGAALALAALGLGSGLAAGRSFTVLGTTLAYLPAALVFAGVAVALQGWAPRLAGPVTWTLLGAALVLDLLGEFRLAGPDVLALSPFVRTLVPLTSGEGLGGALVALSVVALVLAVVGVAGLRRRDLTA